MAEAVTNKRNSGSLTRLKNMTGHGAMKARQVSSVFMMMMVATEGEAMALYRKDPMVHVEWAEEMIELGKAREIFLQIEIQEGHVRVPLSHVRVDERGTVDLQQESAPGYSRVPEVRVLIPATDRASYTKTWDDKGAVVLSVTLATSGQCRDHPPVPTHTVHVSNRQSFLASEVEAEGTGLRIQ
jgi:hypothetical protein